MVVKKKIIKPNAIVNGWEAFIDPAIVPQLKKAKQIKSLVVEGERIK